MRTVFADTFYWVALLNPKDQHHQQVRTYSNTLAKTGIVTTDEVLTEVLNFLSTYDSQMRQKTVLFINKILQNSNIQTIHQSHNTFLEGLTLYAQRQDKEYSLTDCISMDSVETQYLYSVKAGFRQSLEQLIFYQKDLDDSLATRLKSRYALTQLVRFADLVIF
jgi:predicted nucleic acid-binding protein